MARKEISALWNRLSRNNINDNFEELYNEYIQSGINAEEALQAAKDAVEVSNKAIDISEQSKEKVDGMEGVFEEFFSMFSNANDFWAVELFEPSLLKQGGLTSSGATNSLTRTHAYPIKVKPSTRYYFVLPETNDIRIRSVWAYKNGNPFEMIVRDTLVRGIDFYTPKDISEIAVSFAKVDINENLTVEETAGEVISLFEMVFNPINLFKESYLLQGGINNDGTFTDSGNRTRTELIHVNPLTVHEISLNELSNIRIRSIAAYKDGVFDSFVMLDSLRTSWIFTTPKEVNEISISFAKTDINSPITTGETVQSDVLLREVYK